MPSLVTPSENLEALDKKAKKGSLYFYYVTSVNSKGIESGRSQEVSVRR
ncbi:MAG TPA: hypothetical protein VIS48_13285 [Candidatus Kryptonia bacterium]